MGTGRRLGIWWLGWRSEDIVLLRLSIHIIVICAEKYRYKNTVKRSFLNDYYKSTFPCQFLWWRK